MPRLLMSTFWAVALGMGLVSGCSRPQPKLAPAAPPQVEVQTPTIQDVVEYEDFVGRTEALVSVELRSRVTGYLDSVHFVDGADVAANQQLFIIDPKLYQAEFDKAEASVKQAQALLARLSKDYERASQLLGTRALSREEFDRVAGDKAEAEAALEVALATQKFTQQNLNYTRIMAPFAGRISRRYVDPGNLIKADDTVLTNIVQLNPIFAYFDVDDRTLLQIRRSSNSLMMPPMSGDAATTDQPMKPNIQVDVGLPDSDTFELSGTVNFFDNRIDPGTSTLRFRAQIDNTNLLLSPGLFVRVRLKLGTIPNAILVPDSAIGSNQEHKFVYVVQDDDVVREQRVTLGSQQEGLRVITTGLTGTERVVVSGLQKVRPKVKVTVKASSSPSAPSGDSSASPPSHTVQSPSPATTAPAAGS